MRINGENRSSHDRSWDHPDVDDGAVAVMETFAFSRRSRSAEPASWTGTLVVYSCPFARLPEAFPSEEMEIVLICWESTSDRNCE